MPALYSIGYATKPVEQFIEQLQRHRVEVIADVRSVPYSKVFHDYHRETLAARLRHSGIKYVYLGEELGPRSKDDSHYDAGGQVQFDRLMASALFNQGIDRLRLGLEKGYRIALLCAEKDPAVCHRSLLIGYPLLHEHNLDVQHIGHDGDLESQRRLEQRLASLHQLDTDLFMSEVERLRQAYQLQVKNNAYIRPAVEPGTAPA